MAINYWLSTILFVFSVVTLISGIYAFRVKHSGGATVLGIFAVTVSVYCSCYAIEIIESSLCVMQIFHSAKIIALSFLPSLVLLMTYKVVRKNKKIKPWFYILIFSIPLITIVLRLTYEYQSLYYFDFVLNSTRQFNTLEFSKGVWYYIYGVYGISALLGAALIHVTNIKKVKDDRNSSIIILFALAIPLISGTLTLGGAVISGIIILPFTLPITALLIFIATVKYGIFDFVPLAHSKAFEWSDNGIIVLDPNFCLVDINPAARVIFPQISKNSFGKEIKELIDESEQIKSAILYNTECRIEVKKENELCFYKINSSALLNKKDVKTGYMVNIINITELVHALDELAMLVSTDTLTGAQTRRHFFERAEIEFFRAKRFEHALSFIMLDLDYFKKVNDEFGHRAGDELLKNVTNICKKVIRSIDSIGRFGGEEFMILLPETGIAGASVVAERIRELVEKSILLFEHSEIGLTVSLGVTGVEVVTTETLDKFLKYADKALYMAKNNGRNRVEVLPINS